MAAFDAGGAQSALDAAVKSSQVAVDKVKSDMVAKVSTTMETLNLPVQVRSVSPPPEFPVIICPCA